MKWPTILIIVMVLAIILLLKRVGQISAKDVREHLKQGAQVVDVRSPSEFNSGHLSSAINIPLDEIETSLPLKVRDKNQVLLLHCQSGMRSGVAVRKLKTMGYTKAFNLGSLARAKAIVGAGKGD